MMPPLTLLPTCPHAHTAACSALSSGPLPLLQIIMCLSQGKRPPIPQPAELPGPGSSDWQGLPAYHALMEECWSEDPEQRPAFVAIVDRLQELQGRLLQQQP